MRVSTLVSHWIRRATLLVIALLLLRPTAHAEPSMWVVRDQDSTIYLVGTVHLLKPQMVWQSDKLKKTIAESTELWVEATDRDNEAENKRLLKQYGIDTAKPLSAKLNPKQKAKLTEVAASLGLPRASLEVMKPWLVASMVDVAVLQKAGYSADLGVENILESQAKKEGDKIIGLESMEQQFRLLADLPEAEQIAYLSQTLDQAERGKEMVDRMANAWMEGNDAVILDVMVEEVKAKAPRVYNRLVVQRNVRWSEKVKQILAGSGVHQIAVGAGHLVGGESVQAQLAKSGIKAERY